MATIPTSASLATALLQAVRDQRFDQLRDYQHQGAPIAHFPSIDLAVAAFPQQGEPLFANVLFSRDYPTGFVAEMAEKTGSLSNVQFLKDQTNAQGDSIAWARDADWQKLSWQVLAGEGGHRVVAPYPASLIKMMVAVGIAHQIDRGGVAWEQPWRHHEQTRSVADWVEAMVTVSCNSATDALVALLHTQNGIFDLHALLSRFGLATLQLRDTRADGGWRNADGAGCGHLHMTAWDSLRLFWLLDCDAPPAPWLTQPAPFLSLASTARLRAILERQGLHTVLSSGALAGFPDWQPGIPALMPGHWISADGAVQVAEHHWPADVRVVNQTTSVTFAHKTGGTDNYCSDAGIVRGRSGHQRHYLIALLSNMGRRYAVPPDGVVSAKLAGLGQAVDQLMTSWME